jgi:FkbM family methyltransferase
MLDSIKYYYSRFGMDGLMTAIKAKLTKSNILIKVDRQDIRFPFYLRARTSDLLIFEQIFVNQEYDFKTQDCPRVIVDAGAHIGLASIYFSNRYPESKIIAIEPEISNYKMLKKNVASYNNIITLNAALWDKNEEIDLVDPGIGNWGFMTQAEERQGEHLGNISHKVHGMTIDKIMDNNCLEKIDILKMDIEGAEREVFMNSSSWLGKVDALIIELHEWMKSGCNRSFYNGSNGFDDEWKHGENVYLSRRKCLIW